MKFVLHADGSESGADTGVVVPWWSFTKTQISALVLTLVRDRSVSLDNPLPDQPFSLRELLQHRAGLADYGGLPAYHAAVAADEDAWPLEHLLAQVAPLHARATRGEFCYSNVGYALIRQHLEKVTGRSLQELLCDRLWSPLGLVGPTIAMQRDDLDTVRMGTARSYDPRWIYHGLAIGTLRDAALLLHGLVTSDLLPQNLRDEMSAGVPVDDPGAGRPWQSAAYGLGVMTGIANNGMRVVGHTGGGPGSGIAVYRFSATSVTAAVFMSGTLASETERETFALGAEARMR